MTLYLLIVDEDGDVSYSLWKTEASAKSERTYLKNYCSVPMDNMDIVEVDAND